LKKHGNRGRNNVNRIVSSRRYHYRKWYCFTWYWNDNHSNLSYSWKWKDRM